MATVKPNLYRPYSTECPLGGAIVQVTKPSLTTAGAEPPYEGVLSLSLSLSRFTQHAVPPTTSRGPSNTPLKPEWYIIHHTELIIQSCVVVTLLHLLASLSIADRGKMRLWNSYYLFLLAACSGHTCIVPLWNQICNVIHHVKCSTANYPQNAAYCSNELHRITWSQSTVYPCNRWN